MESEITIKRKAAIVTVGTELVEGLRQDTNGPTISIRLSKLGFEVCEIASVADSTEVLSAVYRDFCSRFPLVVSTGGLGPTHDDVTRPSAASALGLTLYEDERLRTALERWASYFADSMIHDEILQQAQVIDGAEVIDAIAGTAPAQVVATPAGELLLLPGPPGECMPLFDVYAQRLVLTDAISVDFSIFGLSESEVQHYVQPLIADYPGINFCVLASPVEVHAILIDEGQGKRDLLRAADAVRNNLGDCIFSECGDSLQKTVIDMARARGIRISCAESCTGGRIAASLTDVAGSSDVFVGGVVSYANSVKENQLGVSSGDIQDHGAVSSQVAAAMADGVRSQLGSDLSVSSTGVAGPSGGSSEKPVGMVWFGVSDATSTETICRVRPGTRHAIQSNAAAAALDLLRRRMLGLSLVSSIRS